MMPAPKDATDADRKQQYQSVCRLDKRSDYQEHHDSTDDPGDSDRLVPA